MNELQQVIASCLSDYDPDALPVASAKRVIESFLQPSLVLEPARYLRAELARIVGPGSGGDGIHQNGRQPVKARPACFDKQATLLQARQVIRAGWYPSSAEQSGVNPGGERGYQQNLAG